MKNNPAIKVFLWVHGLFLVLGGASLLLHDKGYWVRFFQSHHSPSADVFFFYLTYLGDGAFLALLALVFAIYRYKYTVALLCIGIGQFLLAACCKFLLFGRTPRPAAYFEGVQSLHFVEGLRVHHWYSFPSGHTLTAFGLFFFIALVNEKRGVAIACACMAILIGVSRVYLALHFLEDIMAGSVLGVILTGVVYSALYRHSRFWGGPRMNRSLLGSGER